MATRECPLCREQTGAASAVCDECEALIGPAEPSHGGTCPSCGGSIHLLANRCKHCKSDLRAAGEQSVTRKSRVLAISRHGNPPLPSTDRSDCSACDPTALEIVEGEVVAYDLTGCDDEWCYYNAGPGGIV